MWCVEYAFILATHGSKVRGLKHNDCAYPKARVTITLCCKTNATLVYSSHF